MSEITVVAVITAKPGGEDTVRDALSALVAPTREESGCIAYSLYESSTVTGTFITVENWQDQSDLDAHMQTPHIAATFAAAGEQLAAAPAIHVLTPIDVA